MCRLYIPLLCTLGEILNTEPTAEAKESVLIRCPDFRDFDVHLHNLRHRVFEIAMCVSMVSSFH